MVFKQNLTPLTKGGAVHKHAGKGSQMAPMPQRSQISSLARNPGATMNDYAKASPMPSGQVDNGLGSGDFAGNGM